MNTHHNDLKHPMPLQKDAQLHTVYKISMKPNRMYMMLLRSNFVYYMNTDNTFAANNAKHCIENPAKFVAEHANTEPYVTNIIDGHWLSEEGDIISDNVRTFTFCTMTGTSMHPIKGIIYTDPELNVCSIDSAGNVHYYKKSYLDTFTVREVSYSVASGYAYTDTLTESHTLEEFQQICKMLEMPFPCLI